MNSCLFTLFSRFGTIILLCTLGFFPARGQQQAYFVDGYHGGVWGHYPPDYTRFLLDQLADFPAWKLNLEIEPETFDWVKQVDPDGYGRFSTWLADPITASRIEFVNPTYAQPYLFNISGESIIRQFDRGIRHLRYHFPDLDFLTYAAEEPCFTSALPQLLQSFGFRYASLKNPNTCWGGYVRAYGRDLVQWQGPDGTSIPTAPRYGVEELKPGSTWETIGNTNSRAFISAALQSGVRFPVGMCLQDAGWYNGPWLGKDNGGYQPTELVRWRDYFDTVIPQVDAPIWRLSQEDIQVSLVWGAQVLQRVAQQVRRAESQILTAERVAAIDWFFNGTAWPGQSLDYAWKNLMLAQHHDCWIVPYNQVDSLTWAGKTDYWTAKTLAVADTVLASGETNRDGNEILLTVTNTLPYPSTDVATYRLAGSYLDADWVVVDAQGTALPSQLERNDPEGHTALFFQVDVPALASRTYRLSKRKQANVADFVTVQQDGPRYIVQSDRYRIAIDTLMGGVITSLQSKHDNNREWVTDSGGHGFNELRGFFADQGQFRSSTEHPATIRIVEHGPVRFRLAVHGQIAGHPVVQEIQLVRGEARIDFELMVDWQNQPRIARYIEEDYKAERLEKAFYNDRYKLLVLFPVALAAQRVVKNAPFDVTESTLEHTFFDRWDSIKNNIILDWVDVVDGRQQNGLALFTDHTTSYVHGKDHPLGLTVQYTGKALWGRDYGVDGPTRMAYSLLPHNGSWHEAQLWHADDRKKSPLVVRSGAATNPASLLEFDRPGYQLSGMVVDRGELVVRVFNAAGDEGPLRISLAGLPEHAAVEELDGRLLALPQVQKTTDGRYAFQLAMPRFGIRTVRLRFDDHPE